MRTSIRRVSLMAGVLGVLLAGAGIGRFVIPRLEVRSEVTAIIRSGRGRCSVAMSTTTYFLGQPRDLIDGGLGLECGERRRISDDAFLYCQCD